MSVIFSLLFLSLPFAALWAVICYGPIPNRWWKEENPLGVALFVGGITFLLGFIGPILITPSANQGPLLGIFITGPLGFVLGIVWGLLRAVKRRDATKPKREK